MNNNIILLIFTMMVVTYLPRVIPFFVMNKKKTPEHVKQFLNYIPFAILGALIIPDGINAIEGNYLVSSVSLLIAGLLAWKRGGIILPIVVAIIVAVLMQSTDLFV